jgi:hypothetical protein
MSLQLVVEYDRQLSFDESSTVAYVSPSLATVVDSWIPDIDKCHACDGLPPGKLLSVRLDACIDLAGLPPEIDDE